MKITASAVVFLAAASASAQADRCCQVYNQFACDHNDGNFFPATCCSDGGWRCQARGMMGSVCKFQSPSLTIGQACGPSAVPKCPTCVTRFVIGKATNATTSGKKNYGQLITVTSSGAAQLGYTAVVFEWFQDNFLRNVQDGRCLSVVSGSKLDYVPCAKASRWETLTSMADNGELPEQAVVNIVELNGSDKRTGTCAGLSLTGTTLRAVKCADTAPQQWVLALVHSV